MTVDVTIVTGTDVLARALVARYPFEAARMVESASLHDAAAYLESLPTALAVEIVRRVNSYTGTRLVDTVDSAARWGWPSSLGSPW